MEPLFFLVLLQIVTESLPISSGGHQFILAEILKISTSKIIFEIFDHLSHGLTLLCILIVFWRDWSGLAWQLFNVRPYKESYRRLFWLILRIMFFVFVATAITGILYGVIKVWLAEVWWIRCKWSVLIGLIITMISLLSLRRLSQSTGTNSYDGLTIYKVMLIGFVQGMALLPGISRFGITYVVGRWLNVSPRRSIQFSFLLHVPLICFACAKALFKLKVNSNLFGWESISFFYSIHSWFFVIIATVLAYFALRFAYGWALKEKLWRFGIYMVVPCLIVMWLL